MLLCKDKIEHFSYPLLQTLGTVGV